MIFLDGVDVKALDGRLRFCWVKTPMSAELSDVADVITHRAGRNLGCQRLQDRHIGDHAQPGEDLDEHAYE